MSWFNTAMSGAAARMGPGMTNAMVDVAMNRGAAGAGMNLASSIVGGSAAGAMYGTAWDYDPIGGAIAGAKAGAMIGMGLGARTMYKSGTFGSMAKGAAAKGAASYKAGNLLAPGLIGAGVGAMTGPSDSTFSNIMMGAAAGIGGSKAVRMGSNALGFRHFSMNLTTPKLGTARGFMGSRGNGSLYAGIKTYGNVHKKYEKSISVGKLGAGTGALFAPHAAHGLIGGSRRDKSQNQLNRY
jgi:hypothetical protein